MQPATSTSPTGEKIASAPTSVIDRLTASARETAFAAATATLSELGQASWQMRAREAARLGVGLTMRGLDKSLRGTKGAKPFIVGLRAALDTELGLAAYAVAAGTVMSAIPRVTAKPSRKRLASELRIFGFRTIMERYADPFVDGLLGIFDTVLEGTTDADAETP